jgi:hypothetical protein
MGGVFFGALFLAMNNIMNKIFNTISLNNPVVGGVPN